MRPSGLTTCWHPGQLGDRNYFGPHDGYHMSSTALAARQSGRVLPLMENPAIGEAAAGAERARLEKRAPGAGGFGQGFCRVEGLKNAA